MLVKKPGVESRGRNVKPSLPRYSTTGPSNRRGDPARYNVMERVRVGRPVVHQNSPSTSLRSSPFFIRVARFFLRASERVPSARRRRVDRFAVRPAHRDRRRSARSRFYVSRHVSAPFSSPYCLRTRARSSRSEAGAPAACACPINT